MLGKKFLAFGYKACLEAAAGDDGYSESTCSPLHTKRVYARVWFDTVWYDVDGIDCQMRGTGRRYFSAIKLYSSVFDYGYCWFCTGREILLQQQQQQSAPRVKKMKYSLLLFSVECGKILPFKMFARMCVPLYTCVCVLVVYDAATGCRV